MGTANFTNCINLRLIWGWGCLCMLFSGALVMGLEKVSELRLPRGAAEILSYDPATKLVFSTRSGAGAHSVVAISVEDAYKLRVAGEVDLRKAHPRGTNSVSSVAVDPLGRGFLAVSLIPKHATVDRGVVAIVDTRTRGVVKVLDAGWHPDCVSFSKDGRFLLVANEGEYAKRKTNTPGSLGVVDLKGVRSVADVSGLKMEDYPLGPREVVKGVRIPYAKEAGQRHLDLEPEYVTSDGVYAWVSLQENNALAVFDLRSRKWSAVRPFGSWPVRMDVSDRDGPWARREVKVATMVEALPMPDTIAYLKVGGRSLIFTANEGEGDNIARVKHLGTSSPKICPDYRARLKAEFGVDPQHDSALGRLQVSVVDGLNERGEIEKFHAVGTRSFSIWDGMSGKRVWDSGSFFEDHAAGNDRGSFNQNRGSAREWDRRSDNRGPETEAIAAGVVRGVPMVFVGNERQNGLYAFSVSNPAKPVLKGYYNGSYDRHSNPECVLVLPKEATPLGREMIMTAWEATSSITLHVP